MLIIVRAIEEADVGMPKAKDPDRDEKHTRVCEVWGPRNSRGLSLAVGKLPSSCSADLPKQRPYLNVNARTQARRG